MTEYGVLLENPRRRRRRTPPRGAGGRFKKRKSATRRRRNPAPKRRTRRRAASAAPATRRRRRASPRRRTTRRRRRNPSLLPGRGAIAATFRRGTQILVGDIAGDTLARVANKFGLQKMLTQLRVPANMQVPATRIMVGLFGPRLLKMLPGRLASADFRATFGAINVAQALMELTRGMRTRALQTAGLADYEYAYPMPPGMGDYELTAGGGQQLGDTPYGMLGDTPYGMLSDYEYEAGAMSYY